MRTIVIAASGSPFRTPDSALFLKGSISLAGDASQFWPVPLLMSTLAVVAPFRGSDSVPVSSLLAMMAPPHPVFTRRTTIARVNLQRLRAHAIEAAEQCGILTLPDIGTLMNLDQLAVAADARTFAHLTPAHALKGGVSLPTPEGVFPRYGDPKAGKAG